jgi:glycosyltransferase involved in cell wall biosynthesis
MGYVRSTSLKYFLRKLSYLGYKHSVSIVPLSNDMANQILISYNINPDKIFVLPNFSSSQYFSYSITEISEVRNEVLKGAKQKIIIYPGTFGHVNGLEYIVSLALELLDSSYVFLVIGSGREMQKIVTLVKDKKLDNVFILNSVPKSEVFKYIAASDYLISTVIDIPELNWNSANKYFDGLCAGKPVIINHEGWQALELRSTLSGIVIGKDIKHAGVQLKSICDEDYDKLKSNVINLSKKYEKEIIQERLIKIVQNDKGIPNMY